MIPEAHATRKKFQPPHFLKFSLSPGEFPELKSVVADHLMFIKEDTILPNTISFHDLIKNKARGLT